MTDLFLDTLAGQVIRAVSGGRLCSLQDPTANHRPTHNPNDDSLASFDGQTVSTISEKERGTDFELVSWYGDNDPAVGDTISCSAGYILLTASPRIPKTGHRRKRSLSHS